MCSFSVIVNFSRVDFFLDPVTAIEASWRSGGGGAQRRHWTSQAAKTTGKFFFIIILDVWLFLSAIELK
jgi:hypothetical protein